MKILLTTKEYANLIGISERHARRLAGAGQVEAESVLNVKNRAEYMFPLSTLPTPAQLRYFQEHGLPFPIAADPGEREKEYKPLDRFSAVEREEISETMQLLERWKEYRRQPGSAAELDEEFVAQLRREDPARAVSVKTLYRKKKALEENNLEGLVDKRGKARKGKSSIDETVWQVFLSFYLDLRTPPAKACYEDTIKYIRKNYPERAASIPTYSTFLRHIEKDVPYAVQQLGREGKKAMRDRCAPYVQRIYDTMESNEIWVADNHTFDVMSRDGKSVHRLYLTAFYDARSGIFTGACVTSAPSSQSTVIALRRGILRYGIPDVIYVDNGREFLTFDLGGLGHRQKKNAATANRHDPPTIRQRLGIEMMNAQVKNARAKIIERRFLDFKNRVSKLFETYTGGNVLEKPENLEKLLRVGKGPTDRELTEAVEQLLEGYLNEQPYGGAVARDRGKPRVQVYNENLHRKRVPRSEEDLNLLLMRSTRAIKVDRPGVYLKVGGVKLYYRTDDFVLHFQGQKVYLRYDPLDLSHVRAYDEEDRFLAELPVDSKMVLNYRASAEEVKEAQQSIRGFEKLVAERMAALTLKEIGPNTRLDLALETARENIAQRGKEPAASAKLIELHSAYEEPLLKAVGDIDLDRMINNIITENGGYEDE